MWDRFNQSSREHPVVWVRSRVGEGPFKVVPGVVDVNSDVSRHGNCLCTADRVWSTPGDRDKSAQDQENARGARHGKGRRGCDQKKT